MPFDAGNFERLEELIAPDASFEMAAAGFTIVEGRTAIIATLREARTSAVYSAQPLRIDCLDDDEHCVATVSVRYPTERGWAQTSAVWLIRTYAGQIAHARRYATEADVRAAWQELIESRSTEPV